MDSVAGNNFVTTQQAGSKNDWKPDSGKAIAANGGVMEVKGKVSMTFQELAPLDHKILDGIDENILSVSKIADTGSVAVFDKDTVKIYDCSGFHVNDQAKILAKGQRSHDGLYRIEKENVEDIRLFIDDTEKCLKMKSMNSYYSNIKLDSDVEIARFFHSTFGYPTISTMHAALKRHLELPGLDHNIFVNNAPRSIFTARGHLHNLPQGTSSTKPERKLINPTQKEIDAISAKYDIPRVLSPGYMMDLKPNSDLAQTAWYVKLSQRLSVDGTGNMTVPAYNGDTQIMIVYHAATNFIRAQAFKSKTEIHGMSYFADIASIFFCVGLINFLSGFVLFVPCGKLCKMPARCEYVSWCIVDENVMV